MMLTIELSPEKEAALKAQAHARGLTVEQWLLQLAEQSGASLLPPESQDVDARPVWEIIVDNMKKVPAEDAAAFPRDGASQIDHYVYGLPKTRQ
jgi:hypothetical protein